METLLLGARAGILDDTVCEVRLKERFAAAEDGQPEVGERCALTIDEIVDGSKGLFLAQGLVLPAFGREAVGTFEVAAVGGQQRELVQLAETPALLLPLMLKSGKEDANGHALGKTAYSLHLLVVVVAPKHHATTRTVPFGDAGMAFFVHEMAMVDQG